MANRVQTVPSREPANISPISHQMGQGGMSQRTNRTLETTAQQPRSKKGLKKRANIKIGTININGLHTTADRNRTFEKWTEINVTMRNEKIAILAVQEMHLDKENTTAIHQALGKRIVILNSQLEANPRTSAGVAFVLNRDLIDTTKTEKHKLIKGRALALKITWKNNEVTNLINIYTPNRRGEHKDFWETVENEQLNRRLCKPDFVLGDFNITEEPIDKYLQEATTKEQ